MGRANKQGTNYGSLKVGEGKYAKFRSVEYKWDEKESGFFIHDRVSKRRYGPFTSAVDVASQGYTFFLDGGKRAAAEAKAAVTAATEKAEFSTVA